LKWFAGMDGLLPGVGLQTRVKDLVHAGIPSAL